MIPDITTLQFLVLTELAASELAGHELRDRLAKQGAKKSGPAFYQLMSRLEEAKLVKGRYQNIEVEEGQIVRERRYKITNGGLTAVEEFQLFANRSTAWKGASDAAI